MEIAYIFFIIAVNTLVFVTLYIRVNKKAKLNSVFWYLWATVLAIIACHAKLFSLRFLLPIDEFLIVAVWSLAVAIAHLITVFYREQIGEFSWSRQSKELLSGGLFFNLIAMYMLTSALQCEGLVAIAERYYQ